jgi:hypothetical protein
MNNMSFVCKSQTTARPDSVLSHVSSKDYQLTNPRHGANRFHILDALFRLDLQTRDDRLVRCLDVRRQIHAVGYRGKGRALASGTQWWEFDAADDGAGFGGGVDLGDEEAAKGSEGVSVGNFVYGCSEL